MVSSGMCLMLLLAGIHVALTAPTRRRQESEGCSRSSLDLSDCVGNSIQHFVNFMASGKLSPKVSVTPFDPLLLPNMTITHQSKEFKAVFVNRYLVGLKNSFVHDTSVDLKKKELSLTLLMPALELLGMYTTESIDNHEATENTILTISIRSSAAKFRARGDLYKASTGFDHIRLNVTDIELVMGHYTINDLDHSTHIPRTNRHFDSVSRPEFVKLIEKDLRVQLGARLQHIANEVLALAPYQKLFPV
ncbi:AAEL001316-PA [Aedes aegypti]|uniref:AAEL001316-PA n=1 Tax=Aedes aegypti TaxID=7159 RepID=Q17LL4_AEDAE|nr:AAEL001316-PA [Aedes aegypti]